MCSKKPKQRILWFTVIIINPHGFSGNCSRCMNPLRNLLQLLFFLPSASDYHKVFLQSHVYIQQPHVLLLPLFFFSLSNWSPRWQMPRTTPLAAHAAPAWLVLTKSHARSSLLCIFATPCPGRVMWQHPPAFGWAPLWALCWLSPSMCPPPLSRGCNRQ